MPMTLIIQRRHGQSLIECALLLLLVVAALVAMQGYLRGALASHMKRGADGIGHGLRYSLQ